MIVGRPMKERMIMTRPITDLSGLAPPHKLAGASLRPLLDDPAAAWDRPALTQTHRGNATKSGAPIRSRRSIWPHGSVGWVTMHRQRECNWPDCFRNPPSSKRSRIE